MIYFGKLEDICAKDYENGSRTIEQNCRETDVPEMNVDRLKARKINRTLLYPSYLAVANQVLHKTGISDGNCLEISAGNGLFGITLAQITDLQIFLMENSGDMLSQAAANLQESTLGNRVKLIKGSLLKIPLADGLIDLVVSRSSIFFWQNQVKAFQEIYRVLAPGGMACIGGGFWDEETGRQIEDKLEQYNPKLRTQLSGYIWRQSMESLAAKMGRAGIVSYEINCGDDGLWIFIRRSILKQEVS